VGAVLKPEIFFGIDAAAWRQVVTRVVPGEGPKPAESMTEETLVRRAAQSLKLGYRVVCVYEAGPTGFTLARKLIAAGAECLVVRARQLERYGRRRKHDKRDSRQLALDLANHCAGRTGLLFPVRIPTVAEELERLAAREREKLAEVRQELLRSAKGRALALGYRLPKEWWRPRVLPKLLPALPSALRALLQRTAAAAAAIKEQLNVVE
jgi:transposase